MQELREDADMKGQKKTKLSDRKRKKTQKFRDRLKKCRNKKK